MNDKLDPILNPLERQNGRSMAVACLLVAVCKTLPRDTLERVLNQFDEEAEQMQVLLLNTTAREAAIDGFQGSREMLLALLDG